ncbi:MAG: glycoside hydrolase family 97 protein [Bacteroidales bacterium]|jgi:alpha-glucosidase|nr:glycoside hydrolase family 97 protein [Bacteroidales bacterium]
MKTKIILCFCLLPAWLHAQTLTLQSPDKKIMVIIRIDDNITYSVLHEETEVVAPSPVSMSLLNSRIWGVHPKLKKKSVQGVRETIPAPFYKKSEIDNMYNELTLTFADNYGMVFRAYNQGVAYRFTTTEKNEIKIANEQVTLNFTQDHTAIAAYVANSENKTIGQQFFNSFENTYAHAPVSKLSNTRLIFLPVAVALEDGKKLCFTEADLENYPGLYLLNRQNDRSLQGIFAPVPKHTTQGGHNMLQQLVDDREEYIARSTGARNFPWRVLAVSSSDKELLNNDLVYSLASPARISDVSWIEPGKVAWDWWNDWNIDGVDFRAGINNETYRYYIDFAARQGIRYVILDEGWAVNKQADLMQVIPSIDIPGLVEYGRQKNVGIILWAGYWAMDRDMDNVCRHYASMGVKGFKVDFMDRDDQYMVNFYYRCAATAAKYRLLVDFHGAYKPTGLQCTYPNVINFEGVFGLEQLKWSGTNVDMVTYDVTMPFIRMLAGPVDYTQGAMRNAIRRNYRPVNSEPMSQGTRCRQLAEYVVFESPLNMLCDSPANYDREQECTRFIAQVPSVWDETVPLDSKMAEYVSIARRKGEVWYIGGLTDWSERNITMDLGFLGAGDYQVELFRDGVNADRAARDYKREFTDIPPDKKLTVHLTSGGGFAGKITKK